MTTGHLSKPASSPLAARPAYQIVWSRWTGKYAASSPARPNFSVIDTDPFKALADLQTVLQLLA